MTRPALFALLFTLPLQASELISYNRDVRPILSEKCFFCHGFDQEKRKGDLRLDTFEGATEGGAIVPGDPKNSELVARIHTKASDDLMPPPDSTFHLNEAEKGILNQWIKEGAEYQEHWSFRKLERPSVPDADATHAIDSFLRRTWDEQGVSPVAKADPRTLLRRLSYDLRGLPPTLEEVATFVAAPSPAHYTQFVDRWLSSLEHAEHQALFWLDLVRYADSNGMVSDEPIASGPYRKYVIESFWKNLPFDQFTREQLAGDLLPDRNDRTLTASAYNRLVKTNSEAGVIEKEALYALKGEHIRALGTVWLGLTTGCAECHDHKYDPITAKDYYSLAAFFDPLIEAGVYEPGDRRVPLHYLHEDAAAAEMEQQLAKEIDEVRDSLYQSKIDPAARDEWTAKVLAEDKRSRADKEKVDWLWFPEVLPVAHLYEGTYTQVQNGREVIAPPGEIAKHFAAETLRAADFGNSGDYFTNVHLDPDHPPEFVALQIVNGAYGRVGWHPQYFRTFYWGPEDQPLLNRDNNARLTHMGSLPKAGEMVRLEIPKEKLGSAQYQPQGMAWLQGGGRVIWGNSGYVTTAHRAFTNELCESSMRYFRELPLNRDDRALLPTLVLTSLKMPVEKRRPIHQLVIDMAFREANHPGLTTKLTKLYREISHHRQGAIPTLVSKVGPAKTTYVLKRGNFMDESGPVATPAIPEVFGRLESDNPSRLDLAHWITSRENPLTARVFVNRLWHQFYGRGFSETLEDSGNQGDWPSHVDLLDWLAAEFQSDWDMRKMIRLLVTSEGYQLSSIPGSLLAQKDPTNRLHARQGRARHGAEEIRDSALAAAGLLTLTGEIPSESFFPYQPGSYWEKSNKIMYGSRYQIWDTSAGASQYQRSLYTFWKRQNIHPSFLALDAPTRQECVARRSITNTPAQALALLNDPQFVEAARCLAGRAMLYEEPLTSIFQFTLQRDPTEVEEAELTQLQKKMVVRFREYPGEAGELLEIGQAPRGDMEVIEHAAWTVTARVVLNLHEFLTRD